MSSNLKVNNILPSTGDTVAVSGIASVTSSVSIASSCTATTFYGSGANLTGISALSLANGVDNRLVTATGAAALTGEANLTFETATSGGTLTVAGTSEYQLKLKDSNTSGNGAETALAFTDSGNTVQGFVGYNYWGDGNLDIQNNNSDGSVCINTGGGNERLHITSTGQLLVGTGSASNRFKNGNGNGATPKFQFETANIDEQNDISLTFGRNNAFGAEIILAKHRAATVGGHTVVQSDDRLGGINFAGADGTHFHPAALIQGRVDGTPGTGDMPGRLEFLTTADGASTPTERMRIRSDGHVQLQHGLTALSGGGVIVCAAKSSSGTANQSNYKVDFVVPMGDLGTKKEYQDIRAQFSSGQTGVDWTHDRGGSGILIATVQNDYYWGYRTKIYHITTYGNSSNNVTSINLLHNYSAAGHGSNSASVDLAVQSHDGKTPKLRATFSGDYWNSNVLTVTYIGSAVASTGNIRQTTAFDSKLTGQDPTWK